VLGDLRVRGQIAEAFSLELVLHVIRIPLQEALETGISAQEVEAKNSG
jgi:hypothetical protein